MLFDLNTKTFHWWGCILYVEKIGITKATVALRDILQKRFSFSLNFACISFAQVRLLPSYVL